jgi:hypothetical protein
MATMKKVNMPHQHKPGYPQCRATLAHALEDTASLEHRQDDQQAEHGEEAAPEGDLEAAGLLQVARDHPGSRPHQGHRHHQRHRSGMPKHAPPA